MNLDRSIGKVNPARGSVLARRCVWAGQMAHISRAVVPVVRTGLHCGTEHPVPDNAWTPRRPRRQDGAPLRPLHVDAHETNRLVVPVVRTGLHCGIESEVVECAHARVVPVVRTGLHCGRAYAGAPPVTSLVVPVVRTGLHCGGAADTAGADGGASRPRRQDGAPLRRMARFRAGGALFGGSSPSSGRGSIAACWTGAAANTEARVVPVVRTGLHCGR